MADAASAGEDAFYFDWNGPVIVDRDAALPALTALARSRPVARSHASAPQVQQIANVRVEHATEIACGTRSPDRLVVCLDADGRFAPGDELALLARVSRATHVQAGSVRARDAVLASLAATGAVFSSVIVVTASADCTGACDGRVVVEGAQ